jgi:hypothetical protein
MIFVAIYCRPEPGCRGVAKIGLPGRTVSYGRTAFSIPGNKTSHVPIRLSSRLMVLVRRHHRMSAIVSAVTGRTTYSQEIVVRVL